MIALLCASFGLTAFAERQVGLIHLSAEEFEREGNVISATVSTPFPTSEFVPSWNAAANGGGIEVRLTPLYPDRQTKAYHLGTWSLAEGRTSINDQDDEHGVVQTDILRLARPVDRLKIEITLQPGEEGSRPRLKSFFLSCLQRGAEDKPQPPATSAWGKVLVVPHRAQHDYEGGNVLCSPTCVAMILNYWARVGESPAWQREVPEIKEGVFDPGWEGTGNWPFNTAYAGSIDGLTGYVSRLQGMRDLELLIEAGIPVAVSVSYPLVLGRERTKSDDGHLMVLIGFTREGDPILNDPAKQDRVRQIYPRQRLVDGWAASQKTVYIIHPDKWPLPKEHGPWLRA